MPPQITDLASPTSVVTPFLSDTPTSREQLTGILKQAIQQRLGEVAETRSSILEDRPLVPRKKLLALAMAAAIPTLLGLAKGGRQARQAGGQAGALASQFLFKGIQEREARREQRDLLELKAQQQGLTSLENQFLKSLVAPIEREEDISKAVETATRKAEAGVGDGIKVVNDLSGLADIFAETTSRKDANEIVESRNSLINLNTSIAEVLKLVEIAKATGVDPASAPPETILKNFGAFIDPDTPLGDVRAALQTVVIDRMRAIRGNTNERENLKVLTEVGATFFSNLDATKRRLLRISATESEALSTKVGLAIQNNAALRDRLAFDTQQGRVVVFPKGLLSTKQGIFQRGRDFFGNEYVIQNNQWVPVNLRAAEGGF